MKYLYYCLWHTSIATSLLRQLGFIISLAAWKRKRKSLQMWKPPYMCASEYVTRDRLVSDSHLLSPECLHRASVLIAELTTQSLCSLCRTNAVGVTLLSAGLSLTARGTASEEVSGHLPLPLHLDNTPTVQLVSVVDQHVVQVCGHLGENRHLTLLTWDIQPFQRIKWCQSQFHSE